MSSASKTCLLCIRNLSNCCQEANLGLGSSHGSSPPPHWPDVAPPWQMWVLSISMFQWAKMSVLQVSVRCQHRITNNSIKNPTFTTCAEPVTWPCCASLFPSAQLYMLSTCSYMQFIVITEFQFPTTLLVRLRTSCLRYSRLFSLFFRPPFRNSNVISTWSRTTPLRIRRIPSPPWSSILFIYLL